MLARKDVSNITRERITTETSKERSTFVTLESKSYQSRKCELGLYYYDTANTYICDKVEVTEVEDKDRIPFNDESMLQNVK